MTNPPFHKLFNKMSLAAMCFGIAMGTAPSFAQTTDDLPVVQVQATTDAGAGQRINLSGKLRMLTQRVAASACYVQAGIVPQDSVSMLEGAVAEFTLIVGALEYGNEDLGIFGAEEHRKTLMGVAKLKELWAPMEATAMTVAMGAGTPQDVEAIATQSAKVLEIAQRLVAEITGQYANPAALRQADAMVIDLAGRQRMLAQRVSKNVCLLSTMPNMDTAAAELALARDTFDSTLSALYVGMPAMGIQAPPTDEIETGLAEVAELWKQLQPFALRAADGDTLDPSSLEQMFYGGNGLTGGMNSVVGLYTTATATGT